MISLERMRPHHLSPPAERFTSAGPEKPAAEKPPDTKPGATSTETTTAPQTPPPAATTGERSSLIPRSLSDVESLLSRIIGSDNATTERKPPEHPAPEHPAPPHPQPQPPRR